MSPMTVQGCVTVCHFGAADLHADGRMGKPLKSLQSKAGHLLTLLCVAFSALLLLSAPARAELDYADLVGRIDDRLSAAATAYQAGDAETAKDHVQSAYFELFENLEGPIRINVSAARSYELEAEFGDIRKLIIDGAPANDVQTRIDTQIAAIYEVLPQIEAGFRLRAEPGQHDVAAAAPDASGTDAVADDNSVAPEWQAVVEGIGNKIAEAADAYEQGDPERAAALVTEAQFAGYKNSLLETAVRRYHSSSADSAINGEFTRIIALIRDGRPARMVAASGKQMVVDLSDLLPGLPILGENGTARPSPPPETVDKDWAKVGADVMARVDDAIATYASGDSKAARDAVQDSYFDLFEASGMEGAVGLRNATLKLDIESHFSRLSALFNSGAGADEIAAARQDMQADMNRGVSLLGSGGDSPWTLFLYSLLIILREGFEAILIVTAIIAYLVKTDNRDKLGTVYNSVLVALALSVVTAIVLRLVLTSTAASREILEGVTMLLAAVVLFFMSYWLLSKAEAEKWMAYIKGTVNRSISSGSLWALWFAGFLAVYREGAETVLFYQALMSDAHTPAGFGALIGGFAVGCIGLAVIYAVMRYGAIKLPIRPFFIVTGLLIYVMAFVFTGKGVIELVEGKLFEPTLMPGVPTIPALGIYPYWQSLLPQAVLVLAALVAWVVLRRNGRKSISNASVPRTDASDSTLSS